LVEVTAAAESVLKFAGLRLALAVGAVGGDGGWGACQNGGKHGAGSDLADLTDAVPHTVLGTHAAAVFRGRRRPSTTALRRRLGRTGLGAAVPLRWLPEPGGDLRPL
jgi:hypothetical protein